MMNRLECLKILAEHVTDEIVAPTYSCATDWMAVNDRPLNYYGFGAMGLASSHALGLALARPEKRVIVLDGDGSLLMNLGTLVTIGAVQPKNFVHFVGHNGSYEANGGALLPNQDLDFAAFARTAGYKSAHTFTDIDDFAAKVGDVIKAEGPVFGNLVIEQGPLSNRDYSEIHSAKRREVFREALDSGA